MTDDQTPTDPPGSGWHRETRAVTEGRRDQHGALAPVLWQTTTFAFDSVDDASAKARTPRVRDLYGRYGNPTVRAFEDTVASLEGAEAALACASGMGAITTALLTLVSAGQHVVAQRSIYTSTYRLLNEVCPKFGIDVTFVDGFSADEFAAAVEPGRTMVVFVETPANPLNAVVDIAAVAAIAGPLTIVDSTFATPMVQRPLEHGADLVVHSATKGLGGHNDALVGVLAGSADLITWIWGYHTFLGAAASPAEALNALRGLRTLGVRIAHQCATAQRLAEVCEAHPAVSRVWYPGLDSHPQREVVRRQMDSGGTLVAVELAGGVDAGRTLAEGTSVAMLAPSLGGPETLISHPATMTHVDLSPDERARAGISDGLVRISVGLEHPDDVIADIVGVLDRLS